MKTLGAEEMKLGVRADEGSWVYRTECQKEESKTMEVERSWVHVIHLSKHIACATPRATPNAHHSLR